MKAKIYELSTFPQKGKVVSAVCGGKMNPLFTVSLGKPRCTSLQFSRALWEQRPDLRPVWDDLRALPVEKHSEADVAFADFALETPDLWAHFDPQVGRAYRFPDGVVRWITGRSTTGMLKALWYTDEKKWHDGGWWYPGTLPLGYEVPAPTTADFISRLDPCGGTDIWEVGTITDERVAMFLPRSFPTLMGYLCREATYQLGDCDIAPERPVEVFTWNHRETLRHALGMEGKAKDYGHRNYYAASPEGDNLAHCRELEAMGLFYAAHIPTETYPYYFRATLKGCRYAGLPFAKAASVDGVR